MKRFTPQEKLEIIRKYKTSGISVFSLCRQYHISKTIFYKWLSLYKRSRKNRIDALTSRVRKGKYHPKSLDHNQKLAILGLVHVHPEYSAHKIAGVLGIGNFGVQTFLYKAGLNKFEARTAFSAKPFWRRQSVQSREGMMDLYNQGWNVVDICKHFNISKPIFYKWKSRWEAAGDAGKSLAMEDRYLRGPAHYKYLDESKKQQIIEVVRNNPDFSVHKIHSHLAGEVGHYTVQNVLKREGLNTYQNRLKFSQENSRQLEIPTAPQYIPQIPLYQLRHLIAHFATVPKLLLTNPKKGLPWAAVYLSAITLLFLWIRLLFTTPYATPLGLFFASIALFFGLFFFIYSMKYYLTVLLVLKLAQGGGSNAGQGRGLGRLGFLGRLGVKLLGLRQKEPGRVNPLTLNLDKIELKTHPFVSVHVALYNEKRVVERLIRACEAQEYYEGTSITSGQGTTSTTGSDEKARDFSDNENKLSYTRDTLNTRGTLAAYEVIIADDSTDGTTEMAKTLLSSEGRILDRTRSDSEMEVYVSSPSVGSSLPVIKLIHRFSRSGFKGAALQRALENTNPRAVYISVFDADFVPYPDTIEQFVKTFQELNSSITSGQGTTSTTGSDEMVRDTRDTLNARGTSNIAAVQGYQWHVLNKSQTWITRGVRTEYAGSYVIERAGEEIYGGLKQIAGSVYAIRADVLRQFGWGTSITEDFELTLRLYEKGYKVAFTPYIQAPAEAVSTIKRLVRQRMRWAEGASYNIKVMLPRLLWGHWELPSTSFSSNRESYPAAGVVDSRFRGNDNEGGNDIRGGGGNRGRVWVKSGLTKTEKLEFAYLAPYYLQAAFFVIGTFSWFISEAILGSRLPFWTAALGWSLVFTNILALPLMNIVGLFLEESDERDYIGILSFIALSYIVVPFQAYAAIKGFLEQKEGPWFRTPKTGLITDTFGRSRFSKFFGDLLGRQTQAVEMSRESWGGQGSWGIGAVKPALAFRPLNAGNFRVRPRYFRYAGNLVLGAVIGITILMSVFAPLVPTTNTYASQTVLKTVDQAKPSGQSTASGEIKEQEITSPLGIRRDFKGKIIEFIFQKEPKFRIKYDNKYELEVKTLEMPGAGRVDPRKSTIKGNIVTYYDITPGVDLVYEVGVKSLVEKFVIKKPMPISGVVQNVITNEVKLIQADQRTFGYFPRDCTKQSEQCFAIFSFGEPQMWEEQKPDDKNPGLEFTLDKASVGYTLTKQLTDIGIAWFNDSKRQFPVIIDPSVIVSTGITEGEVQFGGLQRKVVYASSNWYAFYNDGTDVFYKKSSDGISWGSAVDLDSGDADNYNPSVWLEGAKIYVVWLDDGDDDFEVNNIDTASADALGTKCESAIAGPPSLGTAMTNSITVTDNGTVYFASSDTATDTEVYVFSLVFSGCTFTDITSGSGLTAGDRPVIISNTNTVNLIFQDAGDLSRSIYDGTFWALFNITVAAVTNNVYDVTTDGTNIWILQVSGTTATRLDTYASPIYTYIDSSSGPGTGAKNYITSIVCPSATDCKIAYIDGSVSDLFFVDCDNADCSTNTITDLDTDIGGNPTVSIYCASDTDCKVAYFDRTDGDITFADCADATCSTTNCNTNTNCTDIDTDVGSVGAEAVFCPANDGADCKVAYYDLTDRDVTFADCNNATCSAPTITDLDTDVGANTNAGVAIDCPSATDCKVFYVDATDADVTFIDCSNASCSTQDSGSPVDIDTDATSAASVSVYCLATDDCKLAYYDGTDADISFVDCETSTCATNTINDIDTDAGTTGKNSIYCPSATDCKVVYFDSTDTDITFADCNDATCSAPTVTDIEDVGTLAYAAIYCPAAADCKIVKGESYVVFIDCGDATCSSPSNLTEPWTGQTNLTSATITYDSTNSDLYAMVIMDSSEQAYWKSTDATTISWGSQTSLGFTAGDLGHISAPMSGAGIGQIGVVLRQGTNFEFSAVPENTIYLALLVPLIYRIFGKRKCRARPILNC